MFVTASTKEMENPTMVRDDVSKKNAEFCKEEMLP